MERKIKGVVIHCSAGYGDINAIQSYWRSIGYRRKGYAVFIEVSGKRWFLFNDALLNGYVDFYNERAFDFITNGVAGYNTNYVHICYQGGIDRSTKKAKDTRTPEQNAALEKTIIEIKKYLTEKKGQDLTRDFGIWGHYNFSRDINGSGVIEPFERIKECPSFDVMNSQFHKLYSSSDRIGTLPYNSPNKTKEVAKEIHSVVKGDTLWSISRTYGVPVERIVDLNKLTSFMLHVGQLIILR